MTDILDGYRRIFLQKDKPQRQSSHSGACIPTPHALTSSPDLGPEEETVLLYASGIFDAS
jgi:hypothetical protein